MEKKKKNKIKKEKISAGDIFGLLAFSCSVIAIMFVISMIALFTLYYLGFMDITWSNYYLILGVISAVAFMTLILFSIKLLMDNN
jgi:uncharacterized protein YjfI (DUF2170 family)